VSAVAVALSSTITDLVSSVLDQVPASDVLTISVTSMLIDLPTECVLARGAGGDPEILVGPSQWRWTTSFDRPLGRMRLSVGFDAPEGTS
jgi:hypothetical protein